MILWVGDPMEIPPKEARRIAWILRAIIAIDLIAAGIMAWIEVAK